MAGLMNVPRASLVVTLLIVLASVAAADVPTLVHDGHAYVDLVRLASNLKATADARSGAINAELRTGGHVVRFTRNWARILVDGNPVVLDTAVRVKDGRWMVPKAFVVDVLPKLTQGASPSAAPREPAATLDEMRVRSYPSFTRIVLETSSPVAHRVDGTEGSTLRVRVMGLAGRARTEEVGDGFVDSVKLSRAGEDALVTVRFTGASGDVKASTLSDPPRLVLDVMRPTDAGARTTAQAAGPLRTIVLDAGHGGHDPGATGPGGLMEKDLVLDITRRVSKLVEDRLDIKVLLSRDGDHFVPLKDRTSFANRERADLFVSIHANAHVSATHEGVETYFLSSEATDIAARRTAALENSVVQLEKPATSRGANGPQDLLRAVLWDLAQSEFLMESSRLAEVVQDFMTRALRIPNRGVKQAGFYVLGGAAMPAILIEIGFVTNPKEERRLREGKYRDEIARAIFAGIAEYKRHWDQRMRASVERSR
jgi:N-acetylmuramoyl-L-alanine amidase